MSAEKGLTRREFTVASALAMLSGAEIASIAANQRVSKSSTTTSGHDHTVTFN
jgi:hypothetical protein